MDHARVVLRRFMPGYHNEEKPDFVDEEDRSGWYELDAATCRERIPAALAEVEAHLEWAHARGRIEEESEQFANALELVEKQSGKKPVLQVPYP